MEAFSGHWVKDDIRHAEEKEKSFAPDFSLSSVQKYFKTDSPEEAFAAWQKERSQRHGNMQEMAMTFLLHKMFGDKFIIARASKYDDYERGADNLIIDKKTGQVVCTFDEVVDKEGGERDQKKMEKVIKKAKQGGINIKYGLTVKDGQLKKKSINNIPGFILRLSPEELKALLITMEYDLDKPMIRYEEGVLEDLIKDLEEQRKTLLESLDSNSKDKRIQAVRQNLENFPNLI